MNTDGRALTKRGRRAFQTSRSDSCRKRSPAPMARVEPLRALHYDPAVAGPLQDLAAPPYDVIDPEQRAELAAPLAAQRRRDRPARGPRRRRPLRPRRRAARAAGAPRARSSQDDEPALWAIVQDYTGPDGRTLTRNGFFARVRVEDYGPGTIRPHERTHPGPKEDRLRLTRATRANLSPIFSLYSDPELRRLARARAGDAGRRALRRGRPRPTARTTASGASPTPTRSPPLRRRSPTPSCSSPTATTATRPRASTPTRSAARARTATCSCASSRCRTRA